jgi:hypothetical protein
MPSEARRFSMRRFSLNFAEACLKGYSAKRFVTITMNSLRIWNLTSLCQDIGVFASHHNIHIHTYTHIYCSSLRSSPSADLSYGSSNFQEYSGYCMYLTNRIYTTLRLRMCGAFHPLPHTSSHNGYYYLYLCYETGYEVTKNVTNAG